MFSVVWMWLHCFYCCWYDWMFYVLLSVCSVRPVWEFLDTVWDWDHFFFFFFFLHAWSHVVHICKPSSCNFSSRRALYANCAAKKISGWPLEYWAVELSWEIWFKWVALISCGNLLGTREKKYFGDLCSSSSSEKLFSHLVTKTWGTVLKAVMKGEGCFVWRYKGFEMPQE